MERSHVILVQDNNLEVLPPLLTVIAALQTKYNVIVITEYKNPDAVEAMWNPERVSFRYWKKDKIFVEGFARKIKWRIEKMREGLWIRKEIRACLKEFPKAFCWVGSAETASLLRGLLRPKTYVTCAYELIEEHPLWRLSLRKFYQNAAAVVVPERNRSYIFKAWMGLEKLPFVVPNKPEFKIELVQEKNTLGRPKVILYQGIFNPNERKLEGFCEAIDKLYPEFEFRLIGKENDYSRALCEKYKGVRYGGYFPPPTHLSETQQAYIGVATYSTRTLNCAYCAPNKIWEYAACGLPMLINDAPGLTNALLPWNCAVVVNESDSESILSAIRHIDERHATFSQNARSFYKSENTLTLILSVALAVQEPRVARETSDVWGMIIGYWCGKDVLSRFRTASL